MNTQGYDTAWEAAEDRLRRALRDEASTVRPSAWPARAILARARKRRRTQWLAVAAPVVIALCVSVMVVHGGKGSADGGRAIPAASSKPRVPGPRPPATLDWPAVRVVAPGRSTAIGDSLRMRLDAARSCWDSDINPVGWRCESVVDGNQQPESVSVRTSGDAEGTMYTPLYIGSGKVARMAVTVHGRVLPVHVVTLPGHPGYATGYVVGPPLRGGDRSSDPATEVYDARGRVLASLLPPSGAPCSGGGCPSPDR